MILTKTSTKYESNTKSDGKHLTIQATAKALEILSKNIYSRPIESCVREVSCNCYDAHVEAGIAHKPFEITLPTYSDSTIKFKDYGNGLPPDQIRNIFATYFSSSKTESNAYTGALGLGSKSPLAVADQFTVEMSRDGWYYLWTIYNDSTGYPTMADEPIVKRETTDPTGITVSIPVDYSKRQDFINAVNKVLPYFTTLPTIVNGPQLVRKSKKIEFKSCWFEDGSGAFALMGNVLYPINPDITGLNQFRDLSSQGRLIIPFNLGELDFDASRENLQYSNKTISILKIKYNEIVADFAKTIHAKIDKSKNAYEAVLNFNTVTAHFDTKLANAIYKDMTFNGKPLSSYFSDRRQTNWYVIPNPTPEGYIHGELYTVNSYYKSKFNRLINVKINKNTVFIYNDDNSKSIIARMHCYIEQERAAGRSVEPVYINEHVDLPKWLEANYLSMTDLVKISTLPKPAKSTSTASISRKRAGTFTIKGGYVKSYFWQKVDTVPTSGYYFVKSDDDILIGDEKKNISSVWGTITSLGVNPVGSNLYGISKSVLKDYKDDANFKLAETYIKEKLEAKALEYAKYLAYKKLDTTAYGNTVINTMIRLNKVWPSEGKFSHDLSSVSSLNSNFESYKQLFTFFGVTIPEYTEKLIDVKSIPTNFPMLDFVVNGYYSGGVKESTNYIREWAKFKNLDY